ncbi:FadR/GntR family transcriptional regulator [Phyllobacterium leguminum]|uniref:GntR family transcriptional regulator n=1 Tax=Phyllobacterium leguminum TaxID=314237 RepID=A0A318T2F4_9HYPH|nr:FadR/GntR family transcriptional regulator [Phyllobacterium leguminum]PYE86996.1 GntR family transcriptional regulator [Phyllobacterium leguminum]
MSGPLDRAGNASGSLSDGVYEQIYKSISTGDWPVGAKLPPEIDLALRFGVSRPVVREAMLRLRIDGLIESRPRAGTRVISAPSRSVIEFAEPGSIADLQRCYEFRVGVEGEAAYLAAQRQSRAKIADIQAVVERLRVAAMQMDDIAAEDDIAFHVAVATATENSYYFSAVKAATVALHVGTRIARTLAHSTKGRSALVYEEHKLILDAISIGDAEGARASMRAHIESARRRVFVGA